MGGRYRPGSAALDADADRKLQVLLAELAAASLKAKESSGRWRERLQFLQQQFDPHIEAAGEDES